MEKSYETDEWLMGQVKLGNRQYLAPLVRRYASPLLTYLHRMVGDLHRGEELLHEVLLIIWAKRRLYDFPRPFRPWLFAIATNHCRAAFRRARLPEVDFDSSPAAAFTDGGPSPIDAAIATETAQLVTSAVAALPPRQRAVVALRIWNGLSFAEIGQVVGCTEATARSHMHHGLAAMRGQLGNKL